MVNLWWLITTRWQQHVGFESHPRYHFVLSPPAEDLRPPFRATAFRCTFGCLQARRGACRRSLLDDFSHVSALASCPFIGMQLPQECGGQSSAAERSWPPFFRVCRFPQLASVSFIGRQLPHFGCHCDTGEYPWLHFFSGSTTSLMCSSPEPRRD